MRLSASSLEGLVLRRALGRLFPSCMVIEGGSGVCVGGACVSVDVANVGAAVGEIEVGASGVGVVGGEVHPPRERVNAALIICCTSR